MTKSLYPNILFHFTSKEGLFGILSSTFRVSYARELIIGPNNRRELGVPMVSFCDLKLSELHKFIEDDYGKYGIGLTKEWANRHNLSPVMYISRYSNLTDNIISGIDGFYRYLNSIDNMEQIDEQTKNYQNLLNIYRYIKNYEGEQHRPNKPSNLNYRFADDREWRYVPDITNPDLRPFVPISSIRTKAQKSEMNEKVKHITLHFEPEDIQYLIVEKENNIIELINHLEQVKGRFNIDTRRRLASRILTIEQIEKDI
jgi:hypothetical protein